MQSMMSAYVGFMRGFYVCTQLNVFAPENARCTPPSRLESRTEAHEERWWVTVGSVLFLFFDMDQPSHRKLPIDNGGVSEYLRFHRLAGRERVGKFFK